MRIDFIHAAPGAAMTGFNYYVGLYINYLIDNVGTPPTPPFMSPS
ncbi:MAG: hypothetical protein V1789_02110 [PVC group bacterium]